MPDTPRRRLTRRPPPRPTFAGAGEARVAMPTTRQAAESLRVAAHVAREVPYLLVEMRRVAGVTAVCLGLLAVLVVVDRMG